MPENRPENKAITKEQSRLDTLDKKTDQKIDVGGKDYGTIVFEKINKTVAKINDNFGLKEQVMVNDPLTQGLKDKALDLVLKAMIEIDENNIDKLSKNLELTLYNIENDRTIADLQRQDVAVKEGKKYDTELKALYEKSDFIGAKKLINEYQRKYKDEYNYYLMTASGKKISKEDLAVNFDEAVALRHGEKEDNKFNFHEPLPASYSAYEDQFKTLNQKNDFKNAYDVSKAFLETNGNSLSVDQKLSLLINMKEALVGQSQDQQDEETFQIRGLNLHAGDKLIVGTISIAIDDIRVDSIYYNGLETPKSRAEFRIFFDKNLDSDGSVKFSEADIRGRKESEKLADVAKNCERTAAIIQLSSGIEEETEKFPLNSQDKITLNIFDNESEFVPLPNEEQEKPTHKLNEYFNKAKLAEGKIVFEKKFEEQNADTQMKILTPLMNFLKNRSMNEVVEKATEPGKTFAKVELSLAEGKIADAKINCVAFLRATKDAVINETLEGQAMKMCREKALVYLQQIHGMVLYKLSEANQRLFTKFPASINWMAAEVEFKKIRERNERLISKVKGSNDLEILAQDPSKIFNESAGVQKYEELWDKVVRVEGHLPGTPPDEECKLATLDIAAALREMGQIDNASHYLGLSQEEFIENFNKSPEGQAKRAKSMAEMERKKGEFSKEIIEKFKEENREKNIGGISQEALDEIINESIARAVDGEMHTIAMANFAKNNKLFGRGTTDEKLAAAYNNLLDPNDEITTISVRESEALPGKIVAFAVGALVIYLSAGFAGFAGGAVTQFALGAGAAQGYAIAGGFAVNALVFTAASAALSPLEGGHGFTTMEDFSRDLGKNLLMFGALAGTGKLGQLIEKTRLNKLLLAGKTMSLAEKAAHYSGSLGLEVGTLTGLSYLEAVAAGHGDQFRVGNTLIDNLQTIIGLRMANHGLFNRIMPLEPLTKDTNEWAKGKGEEAKGVLGKDVGKMYREMTKSPAEKKFDLNLQKFNAKYKIGDVVEFANSEFVISEIDSRTGEVTIRSNNKSNFASNMTVDQILRWELPIKGSLGKNPRWRDAHDLETYYKELEAQAEVSDNPQYHDILSQSQAQSELISSIRSKVSKSDASVQELIYLVRESNLPKEQKLMALSTIIKMTDYRHRTKDILDDIENRARKEFGINDPSAEIENVRPFEARRDALMAEYIAKALEIPALKDGLDFSRSGTCLIVHCRNMEDFRAIRKANPNEENTPGGVAMTPIADLPVGLIVVSPDIGYREMADLLRHEEQHIFKQASNEMEAGEVGWRKYYDKLHKGIDFADRNGALDEAKAQEYLEALRGSNMISFKDEVLAYLRSPDRSISSIRETLLRENDLYDYFRRDQGDILKDMSRSHPELLENPVFVARVKALVESAREQYMTEAKKILYKLSISLGTSNAERIPMSRADGKSVLNLSEAQNIRDFFANHLMFTQLKDWNAQLSFWEDHLDFWKDFDVKPTDTSNSKPGEIVKKGGITYEIGEDGTLKPKPFYQAPGEDLYTYEVGRGHKIIISPEVIDHVKGLYMGETDHQISQFDYPTVDSLLNRTAYRLPPETFNISGRREVEVDMGRLENTEALASMSELLGDKIISSRDIDTARLYKAEVAELNKSGSVEARQAFVSKFATENPNCKIQFQSILNGTVLVPAVQSRARTAAKVRLVFGPSPDPSQKGVITLLDASPGRVMPPHPIPTEFSAAEGGVNGDAYKKSAEAWFDTVMLVGGLPPNYKIPSI